MSSWIRDFNGTAKGAGERPSGEAGVIWDFIAGAVGAALPDKVFLALLVACLLAVIGATIWLFLHF